MRKTETIAKTSFKGLIDVQTEKLPQKKSRSRSIRDRNNTTSNQFSVSRTTEYQHSQQAQNQTRNRQATWAGGNTDPYTIAKKFTSNNNNVRKQSQEGIVKFQDNLSSNLSNKSRNQSSIEKIRENMRKESEQLKNKARDRSNSRRRKNSAVNSNNSRSKQNSHQTHANRFPNPLTKPEPSHQNSHLNVNSHLNEEQLSLQQLQQKQALNQIINLKNHLNSLQHQYGVFSRQLNLTGDKENLEFNLLDVTSSQNLIQQHMSQLKEKAEDLHNIVEACHFNLKENFSKNYQQINQKIQKYQSIAIPQQNAEPSLTNQNKQSGYQVQQIQAIINRLQGQFSIGQSFNSENLGNKKVNRKITSNPSFFAQLRQDPCTSFSDLQRKLLLAEQRLLK